MTPDAETPDLAAGPGLDVDPEAAKEIMSRTVKAYGEARDIVVALLKQTDPGTFGDDKLLLRVMRFIVEGLELDKMASDLFGDSQ